MCPALLTLAALLVCAHAGIDNVSLKSSHSARNVRAHGAQLPHGCLYEGRWHTEGAVVTTREACLSCVCARGALSCRRRACSPLPDPPPKRCHVLHRRGACCPELHCPNGITVMEHSASARLEDEDFTDFATPSSLAHACVEGGTVFAAGSALGGGAACEQCFCLHGTRRCVRPRCLPPPHACVARPAQGACCPQRYYCDHSATESSQHQDYHQHDCKVDGKWIQEGDRVQSGSNCTACFCLRGAVRCQPLACAPPLLGCKPLMRAGECCAHQYQCSHDSNVQYTSLFAPLSSNALASTRNDDRSFHSSKLTKLENTTKKILIGTYTLQNTPLVSATINHLVTTTKVKRKTNDPPPEISSMVVDNSTAIAPTQSTILAAGKHLTTEGTTEEITEKVTEQPDGTVKIVINGTINCTAELSSTSMPLNISVNDTEKIKLEVLPRIPIMNTEIEAQTYSPNDIITDRSVNGDFDENETFTINVTSSLRTNTSHSTVRPVATASKIPVKIDLAGALNSSKKTKGDYDYDYTEPTLPPSLPNLKIIPFVAADAVVDDDTPKDASTYPILEREDKFPVYYPQIEKEPSYATRREDVYHPTQYPVFVSDKDSQYPDLTHNVDLISKFHELGVQEYTVSSSLESHVSDGKTVTKVPMTSSTFEINTPAVNLFSPPVETEGGFIPKGPGIIDEYYAVYPSTPSGPAMPHLTTSMQLDIAKGECISADGRHIPEGETVSFACSVCHCAWGEMQCSPRPCHTPPHCSWRPASSSTADLCCGELVCETNNTTSTTALPEDILNETKGYTTNYAEKEYSTSTTHETITETTSTTIHDSVTANKILNNDTTQTPPIITTTEKVTTADIHKELNDTSSQEYDDDDEGFSFGSVLQYLLSENYDTTTAATYKKPSTYPPTKPTSPPSPPIVLPTRRPPTIAPFIPLPPLPYPPKKAASTVNRIDHLVLGEATAIKKTTPQPVTIKTTKSPVQMTTRPVIEEALSVTHEGPRPPNLGLPTGGVGILKLAGCNIYGRMYRVGRIIAELSTPCQECWCTELGVQCKPLPC